jgi:O-antigen ligase
VKEFIRTNYQLYILCILWILVGVFGGSPAAVAFIILSVIILKQKNLYEEMFLGFLVILILSDNNRNHSLAFAGDVKVFYIVLLSAFFFFDRKKFTAFSSLIALFVPFFLMALFLVFVGDSWLISLQKYLSYLLLLFVAPNYVVKIYEEKGSVFFKNIIFLFSIVLLIGLGLKLLNPPLVTLVGRYRGIFGNPNGVGLFCTLFFLLFSVIKEYFHDLFTKGESLFVYFVIIASILLCGSRNAIMCVLSFFLFIRLYKFSPYIGFFVLCLLAVGYELVFQNLEFIIRYLGLGDYFRIQTLETGSGRNVAWTFAWKHIQDNFFLGKGFAYDEILFAKHKMELSMLGHQGNVHNSYLTIWINTGIIGLFLFMRGFILAFMKGAKNSRIVYPVMFVVLFSANFESWMAASLNPVTVQLWIILTIFTSIQFNENKDTVPVH